jgi:hypothetical protein
LFEDQRRLFVDPAWDLRDNLVPIRVTVFHPEEIFCYFISTMFHFPKMRVIMPIQTSAFSLEK